MSELQIEKNAEWNPYENHEVLIERLDRELAECKDNLHKVSLDWQVQAFKVLQMREALELSYNLDIAGSAFYDFENLREEAIALDTKPAEQIVNRWKAQALREAADAIGSYVISDLALRKRADELDPRCRKCGGTMIPGKAIEQTLTGTPDFPGDTRGITMSPGGSGKLIDCLKCEKCGWSVTE